MKITVMYNVEDRVFDSMADAKLDIMERVLDYKDTVQDIVDDSGQHYACEWDLALVFEHRR